MFGTCGLEMRILIREMEFWEHQWGCPRISHIGVCLKNAHILFRFCEVGTIDIFGADRIRLVSLWELLIPIIGDMGIVSDLSWSMSIENGLAVEAE